MNLSRLPPIEVPPGQPYVLLIEDEFEDEALAQRIIKKYRIANHVDWVKDGEEALKLLQQRLGTGSTPGKSQGETSQVRARLRSQEMGIGGAAPLAAPESATRPAEGSPGRPSDAGSPRSAGLTNGGSQGSEVRKTSRTPEMVLLDFGQTKTPPLEVVRRMRALPGMANVPVALCCRTPEEERQVKESTLPRISCLSKPIGFFKLLECIQRMDMHWFVFSEKP